MTDVPLVSVVIPAYNAERFLARAIDSVLSQTYRAFEVIVVDDGSSDHTAEIAKSFGGRVRYVSRPNGGPSAARNTGIRLARGQYVALLDADDRWYPDLLTVQVVYLESRPDVALVFSDMSIETREGTTVRSYLARQGFKPGGDDWFLQSFAEIFERNLVATSTVVVRRSCSVQAGLFDERIFSAEDWDLWLRIVAQAGVAGCPRSLALRVEHGANLIEDIRHPMAVLTVMQKIQAKFPDRVAASGVDVRGRTAALWLERGSRHLDAGRFDLARRDLLTSLRVRFGRRAAFLLLASLAGRRGLERLRALKHRLLRRRMDPAVPGAAE